MTRRAVPGPIGPRGGASRLLALLLVVGVVAAGCGRASEAPAARAAGATPARIAVMAVPGPAPAPPETAASSVSSTAYASLEALRDTVDRLMRGAVDLADTAVHVSRDTVTFSYWYAKASARGWALRAVIRDASGCPVEALERALLSRGWVPHAGYSADGPDGTTLGLESRDYLCVIEGRWDGGDDTDTTYVPAPGCTAIATCVPLRRDDRMR
ncbi:MAG TPA: hypothetical protein VI792_08915 [Candidatus Eisenbacteria bacterium]